MPVHRPSAFKQARQYVQYTLLQPVGMSRQSHMKRGMRVSVEGARYVVAFDEESHHPSVNRSVCRRKSVPGDPVGRIVVKETEGCRYPRRRAAHAASEFCVHIARHVSRGRVQRRVRRYTRVKVTAAAARDRQRPVPIFCHDTERMAMPRLVVFSAALPVPQAVVR